MTDIHSGLQLHLKLNEIVTEKTQGSSGNETLIKKVYDSSGHEKHGTVQGNPEVVADDRFGSCFRFDGRGDSINCGNQINLANSSFTILFWAKRDQISQQRLILKQGVPQSNRGLHIGFRSNNNFTFDFYKNGLDTDPDADTGWIHWACVYNFDSQKNTGTQIIFKNGVKSKKRPNAASYQGIGQLTIGSPWFGEENSANKSFKGSIAHLRIYNRALSVEDIQKCINFDIPGSIDSYLQLHLKLNEISDFGNTGLRVRDFSNHERHGSVVGTPALVSDDRFGSCLKFNGANDAVEVNSILEQSETCTLMLWVKPNDSSEGTIVAGKNFSLTYQNSGWELANVLAEPYKLELEKGKWNHFAIVNKKEGSQYAVQIYLNGVQKNTHQSSNNFASEFTTLKIGSNFKGTISNVRVYNFALLEAEVRQCMKADETALSAFRATHPLEFELYNQQDEAVLYITDAADQTLTLQLTNTSDTAIAFQRRGGAVATQDYYHLQLRFRPNTLSKQSQDRLSSLKSDPSAIAQLRSAGFESTDWSLNYGYDENDQTEWISLLWIKTGQELNFPQKAVRTLKIPFLSAAAAGGARGTRVYLKYANLSIPDGERSHFLNILNRQGKQYIPLHVGFVGSNTILNDGTANELTLRITSLSDQPLSLLPEDPGTSPEFWVYFDYQSTDLSGQEAILREHDVQLDAWEKEWVIGTNGIAQSIEINPTGDDRNGWEDPGNAEKLQTDRPYWILKPKRSKKALLPRETVEFYISNISTYAPTGHTNLYVEYKNIPGYWDGRFICLIEKGPLVYRQIPQFDPDRPTPQAKFVNVGIGTDEPKAKLHVSVATENKNAGADKQPAAIFEGGSIHIIENPIDVEQGLILNLSVVDGQQGKELKDLSTRKQSVTLQGNPQFVEDDEVGDCLSLDDADDYIDLSNAVKFSNSSFTIQLWAKRRHFELEAINHIYSIPLIIGHDNKNILFIFQFSLLSILAFSQNWEFSAAMCLDGEAVGVIRSGYIKDWNWHLYSCVFDNNKRQLYIYIDGQVVDSCSVGSSSNFEISNLYIGSENFPPIFENARDNCLPFTGKIARIMIHERALSSEEILLCMRKQVGGEPKLTVQGATRITEGIIPNYDSGWFSVEAGSQYRLYHGLATQLLQTQVLFKDSNGRVWDTKANPANNNSYGFWLSCPDENSFELVTLSFVFSGYKYEESTVMGGTIQSRVSTDFETGEYRVFTWKIGV